MRKPSPTRASAATGEFDTAYLRRLHIRDLSLAETASLRALGPEADSSVGTDAGGARRSYDELQRLRDEVSHRSRQPQLESGDDSSARPTRLTRTEIQILEKLAMRKAKRDMALATPGGEQIAASYQREIDGDEARLTVLRRAEEQLRRQTARQNR